MGKTPFQFANLTFVAAFLVCPRVNGADNLTLQLSILDTKYCSEPGGGLTLRATVEAKYQNLGGETILLPQIGEVRNYSFYADHGTGPGEYESGEQFSRRDRFSRYDPNESIPNPSLFRPIQPGTVVRPANYLVIIIFSAKNRGALLGKDHYLTVAIDHWTPSRRTGEKLRDRWKPYGLLWIDPMTSLPIKISIPTAPDAEHCTDFSIIPRSQQ
jgi:hypothetical protein